MYVTLLRKSFAFVPKPENIIGSQRKCECAIFAKLPNARKHYRITAKVRICYFEKPPEARKRYRIVAKVGICYLCKASQSQKTL